MRFKSNQNDTLIAVEKLLTDAAVQNRCGFGCTVTPKTKTLEVPGCKAS